MAMRLTCLRLRPHMSCQTERYRLTGILVCRRYNPGSDVFFSSGEGGQFSDDDADNEYVIIEFNALVANIADNNAGDVEVNYFEVITMVRSLKRQTTNR